MNYTASAENIKARAELIEAMKNTPIGGVLTLKTISEVLGGDINAKRHVLQAARSEATEEYGLVFESVYRVGYKRLPTENLPVVAERARSSIRSKARRAIKSIEGGVKHANDVPRAVRRRLFGELSVLGTIQAAARTSTVKRAEQDVERVRAPSVAETAKKLARMFED